MNQKPSKTAELAAMVRALACSIPDLNYTMNDPFARYFLGPSVLARFFFNRCMYWLRGLRAYGRGMGAVGVMCALCRHRIFEDLWLSSLKDGFRQLMLLGAGYDTKAMRYNACTIFELDRGMTQARKKLIIRRKGLKSIAQYISCDLAIQSPDNLIDKSDFRRDVPTVIIAEGLISYLQAPRVHALFHEIGHAVENARLVFDYRLDNMQSPRAPGVVRKWKGQFTAMGERYCSYWSPDHIIGLLNATGFSIRTNQPLTTACAEYLNHARIYKAQTSLARTAGMIHAEK